MFAILEDIKFNVTFKWQAGFCGLHWLSFRSLGINIKSFAMPAMLDWKFLTRSTRCGTSYLHLGNFHITAKPPPSLKFSSSIPTTMQKYLSLAVLASTIVLPTAAVNMAFYEPAQDVDAGFQDFLQE